MNLFDQLTRIKTKRKRKAKVAPIRDSIVAYITANPRCTMQEVQIATNTSDRSIASWMHRLHRDGIIARKQYSTTRLGGRPRFLFWVDHDQLLTTNSVDGERQGV
jgi:predicted transcriptional regulator